MENELKVGDIVLRRWRTYWSISEAICKISRETKTQWIVNHKDVECRYYKKNLQEVGGGYCNRIEKLSPAEIAKKRIEFKTKNLCKTKTHLRISGKISGEVFTINKTDI